MKYSIEDLIQIMNDLRDKCPWDKKQTLDSLKTLTIEEAYELIEAIDKEDYNEINTILARQATLFGVSNLMRNDLMINNFVKSVKEKKEFDVYGKDTWRPNLDVSDCANILLKLVEKEFSGLVNVGTDSLNLSKQDIIDEIPKAIGIDISKYVNYESRNGRTDWPPSHDSRSYKVAFTKLKDLIGGKFIDLNKGIRRLYERNRTV